MQHHHIAERACLGGTAKSLDGSCELVFARTQSLVASEGVLWSPEVTLTCLIGFLGGECKMATPLGETKYAIRASRVLSEYISGPISTY